MIGKATLTLSEA